MRVSWPEFSEELEDCRKCRLCEHRSHIVPGEGNPNAALMFIGEGPGQEEEAPVREAEAVEGVDLAVRSPALLHEDLPFHDHHGGVVGAKPWGNPAQGG